MQRTTDKQLESLCQHLNDKTGNAHDFSIDHAYGGVRLVRKHGSVDVSYRLRKGELHTWILAFMDGIDVAKNPERYS